MTYVTVYRFRVWNAEVGQFIPSLRLGTRAAIEIMRGEIIEGSGTEVPVTDIDPRGFTRPDADN